jgi:hypothetical protein
VVGATPVFLAQPLDPNAGLAATDIQFGSVDAQHRLVVIAPDVATRLSDARLSGVTLTPVAS